MVGPNNTRDRATEALFNSEELHELDKRNKL